MTTFFSARLQPRFQASTIDSLAKLFGGLDGAGVGGGIGIADRVALLSHVVCVNTHPNLTSRVWAGWPSVLPCRPYRLFLHHRHARPIHLHIQDRNRLRPLRSGRSNCTACWISCCSRCGDIRLQSPPPCAPPIWRSPPDRPELSSVRGRDRRGPPGPPPPACGAPRERIPCSRCPVRHRRETGLYGSAGTSSRDATIPPCPPRSAPAWSAVPGSGLGAARTRNGALLVGRGREMQQFGQGCGPGLMHGRAHRHLDGFQIEAPRLAPAVEDDAQQLIYFARDFLTDRSAVFFPLAT